MKAKDHVNIRTALVALNISLHALRYDTKIKEFQPARRSPLPWLRCKQQHGDLMDSFGCSYPTLSDYFRC